jgi:hypothetical protein
MQNLARAGSSAPQPSQERGMGAPHSMQNLAVAGFSKLQAAQRTAI